MMTEPARILRTIFRVTSTGERGDYEQLAKTYIEPDGQTGNPADYDEDGFTDIFVAGLRKNILFRNKGDGGFEEVGVSEGWHFHAYPVVRDAELPFGGALDWARAAPPGQDFPDQGSHPGPWSFFLIAPFYRLTGSSPWGLELGSVAVNLAAIGGIVGLGPFLVGSSGQWQTAAAVVDTLARRTSSGRTRLQAKGSSTLTSRKLSGTRVRSSSSRRS